jgi:hypothetical protein
MLIGLVTTSPGALFLFCNFSPKLRHIRRYSLDSNIPRPPTTFSLQRPRSMLFERGTQHLSTTTSSSPPTTPPKLHVGSSAPGSLSHHVHHASWVENLRDLSKLHWISHAGSPQGVENAATEGEGVDEKDYVSTDTEAEARRDVSARRRERKRRRRKAEIYVGSSVPSHCTALTRAFNRLLAIFRPLSHGRRLF